MEALAILLLVLVFVITPIMAIAALVKSSRAHRRLDNLYNEQAVLAARIRSFEQDRPKRRTSPPKQQAPPPEDDLIVPEPETPPVPEPVKTSPPKADPSPATPPKPVVTASSEPTVKPPPLPVMPAFVSENPIQTKQPAAANTASASDVSAEVRWGSWLATRLGLLLAVIAAVFFGVHVAQQTPPWLRFAGLAGVSLGITLLGHFLERRLRGYGQALFAGGLGLSFFTLWAGYALEPVRVMHSAYLAIPVLFAAVGGIIVCSLWKRREEVAGLAVCLGVFSCWFSWWKELDWYALAGALVLLAGAGGLYAGKRWRWPLGLSLAGSYVIYATLVFFEPDGASSLIIYGFPSCLFAITLVADRVTFLRGADTPLARRMLLSVNSSLAIVFTLLAGWTFYPADIPTYTLAAGLTLLALTAAMHLAREDSFLVVNHLLKAMALLALYAMDEYQEAVRWITLLAQAGVLLAMMRTYRNRAVEVASVLLWGLSLAFMVEAQYDARGHGQLSLTDGLILGGTLLAAVLYLFAHKHVSKLLYSNVGYKWFAGLSGLFLGIVGFASVVQHYRALDEIIAVVVVALGFLLSARALRTLHPVWAGGTVLLLANLLFLAASTSSVSGQLWLCLGLLVVLNLGSLTALSRLTRMRSGWLKALDLFLYAMTVIVALHAVRLALPPVWLLLGGAGLAWLSLGAVALRFKSWSLPDALFLPIAAAIAFFLAYETEAMALSWPMWAALGAGLLLPWAADARVLRACQTQWYGHNRTATVPLFITLAGLGLLVPFERLSLPWMPLAIGGYGMFLALTGRVRSLPAGIVTGMGLLAVADARLIGYLADTMQAGSLAAVGTACGLALLTLVVVTLLNNQLTRENSAEAQVLYALSGLAALLMPCMAVMQPGAGLVAYISPLWGIISLVLFALGVVVRVPAYRLVGLGGLGICLGRIFIYDITETFYRIVAFGVLAGVLLLIGFLYSRLREKTNTSRDAS